ncbi:MAG: hypothetical protein KA287_00445, partial [Rhodoferax sp.]|nr:hypothetical protein [Rhodoferax sp.]MBP7572409.1 hypothetical protein [Rhodoferax sp.]
VQVKIDFHDGLQIWGLHSAMLWRSSVVSMLVPAHPTKSNALVVMVVVIQTLQELLAQLGCHAYHGYP